jgi:hypothetical protein
MSEIIEPPNPWERQPNEPPRAFEAFTLYRNMTPRRRSQAAVCRELYGNDAGNIRLIEKWSSEWRWCDRATAWDDELDRRTREAQEHARRDMAERHAAAAVELQDKALERLRAMKPEELGANDVLRMLVEAAKLERLSRGEPETVKEERVQGGVTLTVEEVVAARKRVEEYRRERFATVN